MQSDYIMRMIAQFVQFLISIIRSREAGKYEEALEQIQTASKYLKTDLSLLLYYSPDQILDLFKSYTGDLDTERCVLCGDLLYEMALIRKAQKNETEALRLKRICLQLYTAAIPKDKQFQDSEHLAKTAALIEQLKGEVLPDCVQMSLRSYEDFLKDHSLNR